MSPPQMMDCWICGKEYSEKSMDIHVIGCERRKYQKRGKEEKNQKREVLVPSKVPCEMCGKIFSPSNLQPHVWACTGPIQTLQATMIWDCINERPKVQSLVKDNTDNEPSPVQQTPSPISNRCKTPKLSLTPQPLVKSHMCEILCGKLFDE